MNKEEIANEIRKVEIRLGELRNELRKQEDEIAIPASIMGPANVFAEKVRLDVSRLIDSHFMERRNSGELTGKGFFLSNSLSKITWKVVTDAENAQVLIPSHKKKN